MRFGVTRRESMRHPQPSRDWSIYFHSAPVQDWKLERMADDNLGEWSHKSGMTLRHIIKLKISAVLCICTGKKVQRILGVTQRKSSGVGLFSHNLWTPKGPTVS